MTELADVGEDSPSLPFAEEMDFIVRLQDPSGLIFRAVGDVADPWNHVEAAMALAAGGRLEQARVAYEWLANHQQPNGSWFAFYGDERSAADHVDTNATAYIAAGVFHYLVASGDFVAVRQLLPVVEKAIDFVVGQQLVSGAIAWCVTNEGQRSQDALLAASSSVLQSILAAMALFSRFHLECPRWNQAASRLRQAICLDDRGSSSFLAKGHYAMDWYYPVLSGAMVGTQALARLAGGMTRFITPKGVLCRSDRRWVTTAETAECALSFARLNRTRTAESLICAARQAHVGDGGYLTGTVQPEGSEFPRGERTSYSAAAVVLAADYLAGGIATTALFSLVAPDEVQS